MALDTRRELSEVLIRKMSRLYSPFDKLIGLPDGFEPPKSHSQLETHDETLRRNSVFGVQISESKLRNAA